MKQIFGDVWNETEMDFLKRRKKYKSKCQRRKKKDFDLELKGLKEIEH
jgi:hypothetical protein